MVQAPVATPPARLVTLVYLSFAVFWSFVLAYHYFFIPLIGASTSYLSKFRYLTMLNAAASLFYYWLCVAGRLAPNNTKLRTAVDYMFSVVALPFGFTVAAMFWVLYSLDPRLMRPAELDAVIPMWLTHALHTAPVPLVLADLCLTRHEYPCTKCGMFAVFLLISLYAGSLVVLRLLTGFWVYPFIRKLNFLGVVSLYGFMCLFTGAMFLLGKMLSSLVWRNGATSDRERRKIE